MNSEQLSEDQLSPHQREQLDRLERAVLEEREAQTGEPLVFVGPAGSGKSTCLKALVTRMKKRRIRCAIIAPTGRAELRAAETSGLQARTLHAASFTSVLEGDDGTPIFLDPKAACEEGDLLICDEASMIDQRQDEVLRTQLPRGSVLLYVGDKEQLPPVAGPWGPHFDAPTAELSEIHRQAGDNPIVQISTLVRTGGQLPHGHHGRSYERAPVSGLDDVASWMCRRIEAKDDALLLCCVVCVLGAALCDWLCVAGCASTLRREWRNVVEELAELCVTTQLS
jgi:energy-coupling factor transporter ATP-binding protein EcfA2